MIDTMNFSTSDFKIVGTPKLKLNKGSYDFETKEQLNNFRLFNLGEKIITGKSAYNNEVNGKHLFCSIIRNRDDKKENGLLTFHTSIPKYFDRTNFYLATKEEYKTALLSIENDFKEIGIHFNIDNCNVTRIDTTKNSEMELPCHAYKDVFRLAGAKRGKVSDIQGETFYNGNKQYLYCGYDKMLEDRGQTSNLLRLEYRLLNKDKIKSVYSDNKPKFFLDNWKEIRKVYSSELKKNVFSSDLKKFEELEKADLKEPLRYCIDTYSQPIRMFFTHMGFYNLDKIVSPDKLIEAYREVLIEKGESSSKIKTYVYRMKLELKKGMLEGQAIFSERGKVKSLVSMYQEMIEKFIKVA